MCGVSRRVHEAGLEPARLIQSTNYEPNLSTKICDLFFRNADDYLFIIFLLLNFGFRT